MDFGKVITELKAGRKLTRKGWKCWGMYIVMIPGIKLPSFNTQGTSQKVNDRIAKVIGKDTNLNCQPYIAMWTAQGTWQPGWNPSQADMFAGDWECMTEKEK